MKIGILVNTDRFPAAIVGLTEAAVRRGHEVIIFAMDEGTRLLEREDYVALGGLERVTMSFCEHSARELSVNTDGVPPAISSGSQFNNAGMNHQADRVLVL